MACLQQQAVLNADFAQSSISWQRNTSVKVSMVFNCVLEPEEFTKYQLNHIGPFRNGNAGQLNSQQGRFTSDAGGRPAARGSSPIHPLSIV